MERLEMGIGKKIYHNFKNKMKEKNVALRKAKKYSSQIITAKRGSNEAVVYLNDSSRDMISARFSNFHILDIYEDFLDFIIELGNALSVKIITFEGYGNQNYLDKHNFKLFDFENMNEKLKWTFLYNGYSTGDDYFYKELQEGFVADRFYVCDCMNKLFQTLCDDEPTTIFSVNMNLKEQWSYPYYFKGYQGNITIDVGGKIFEEFTLGVREELSDFSTLKDVFDSTMERAYEKVKLKNIFEPPMKHFFEFFKRNFQGCYRDTLVEYTFNLLSTAMNSEEIEDDIIQCPAPKIIKNDDTSVIAFELLNSYFLWNLHTRTAHMFDNKQDLKKKFITESRLNEIERHQKILKSIEDTSMKIEEHFL